MNERKIPLFMMLGVILAVLIGYFFILFLLGYVTVSALGGMSHDLAMLKINSLLDFIHAAWLLAGISFLSVVAVLLLLSAPWCAKEIVCYPYRQSLRHSKEHPS